jgi:hypothetical protein
VRYVRQTTVNPGLDLTAKLPVQVRIHPLGREDGVRELIGVERRRLAKTGLLRCRQAEAEVDAEFIEESLDSDAPVVRCAHPSGTWGADSARRPAKPPAMRPREQRVHGGLEGILAVN